MRRIAMRLNVMWRGELPCNARLRNARVGLYNATCLDVLLGNTRRGGVIQCKDMLIKANHCQVAEGMVRN